MLFVKDVMPVRSTALRMKREQRFSMPNFVLDSPTGVLVYASRCVLDTLLPQPLVCQQFPLKKTPDCKT